MPTDQELSVNPFGSGQPWTAVGSHVGRILRSKYTVLRQNPGLLEDIVADVMLDLLDYWSTLASSKTASGYYNWRFAVNRGVKFGSRVLRDQAQRGTHDEYASMRDRGVEDTYAVEEDEMIRLAHAVLESFSYEELQEFFNGILSDTSTRSAAAIYGVSHMTVARSRQAQREKLRQRAREMGLLDA